jgi:hypothetical protein
MPDRRERGWNVYVRFKPMYTAGLSLRVLKHCLLIYINKNILSFMNNREMVCI